MYIDRLEDTYDRSFLGRIALMEVRLREIIVVPRWKQINGCQFIEHHDKVQFEREKEINNEFSFPKMRTYHQGIETVVLTKGKEVTWKRFR